MKDFFNWLFHGDTDPLWVVLFVFGAAVIGLLVLATIFVIAWPLGVVVVFALIFGPPYLAYRKYKKEENQ